MFKCNFYSYNSKLNHCNIEHWVTELSWERVSSTIANHNERGNHNGYTERQRSRRMQGSIKIEGGEKKLTELASTMK